MKNRLIEEYPLLVLPSLANALGLNEAIVLQQMHFWLDRSSHVHDGHRWIYNAYRAWQEQFSFWSVDTVKRTILRLEEQGILIAGNFNAMKIDRTKWYRIDYARLAEILPSTGTACSGEEGKLPPPIPETTTDKNPLTPSPAFFEGTASTEQPNARVISQPYPAAFPIPETPIKAQPRPTAQTNTKTPRARATGSPATYPASYERLYQQYPRKEGKRPGLKAYQAAIKAGATDAHIEAAITAYAAQCRTQGRERQYIKQFDTFLRRAPWEDQATGTTAGAVRPQRWFGEKPKGD